jgi:hypothetical protein
MAYHIAYSEDTTTEESEAFAAALDTARKEATRIKNTVEQKWFAVEGSLQVKQELWFAEHYRDAGPHIGPEHRLKAVMDALVGYDKARHGSSWTVQLTGKEICRISVFTPDGEPELKPGHHRPIHSVRNKEYVLDDMGIPTRRYAFCVRQEEGGAPQLKTLPALNKLFWKLTSGDDEWNEAMESALDAVTAGRNSWGALSPKARVCLAYLNYANNGKLGVCLSSTAKRIRDNFGNAFVSAENFTMWRVDLAKLPAATVLVNLYARTPANEEWTAKRENRNGSKSGGWISEGTVKNRELFCSAVPADAVTQKASYATLLEADKWNWKQEEFFKIL